MFSGGAAPRRFCAYYSITILIAVVVCDIFPLILMFSGGAATRRGRRGTRHPRRGRVAAWTGGPHEPSAQSAAQHAAVVIDYFPNIHWGPSALGPCTSFRSSVKRNQESGVREFVKVKKKPGMRAPCAGPGRGCEGRHVASRRGQGPFGLKLSRNIYTVRHCHWSVNCHGQ
ncbi:hypothetical protein T492DRAFT_437292 [Pavlovales sp. CCMP2436]|nr:hypothetical protein T492DRAFT_437292 [Pavlovales sp. CCMP2436]